MGREGMLARMASCAACASLGLGPLGRPGTVMDADRRRAAGTAPALASSPAGTGVVPLPAPTPPTLSAPPAAAAAAATRPAGLEEARGGLRPVARGVSAPRGVVAALVVLRAERGVAPRLLSPPDLALSWAMVSQEKKTLRQG